MVDPLTAAMVASTAYSIYSGERARGGAERGARSQEALVRKQIEWTEADRARMIPAWESMLAKAQEGGPVSEIYGGSLGELSRAKATTGDILKRKYRGGSGYLEKALADMEMGFAKGGIEARREAKLKGADYETNLTLSLLGLSPTSDLGTAMRGSESAGLMRQRGLESAQTGQREAMSSIMALASLYNPQPTAMGQPQYGDFGGRGTLNYAEGSYGLYD